MEVTCQVQDIAKAVHTVARAVPGKSTLPILQNIKLVAAYDNTLTVAATDLGIAMTYSIPCATEEIGAITVPAELLVEVLASLAASAYKAITFKADRTTLTLTSGKNKSRFKGMDAEEFPISEAAFTDWQRIATISVQEFATLIETVRHTASKEESRPVFSCIYLHAENDMLKAVAADSFRMSQTALRLDEDFPLCALLVGAKLLHTAAASLPENEMVELCTRPQGSSLQLRTPQLAVTCRLTEGTFPDYREIGKIDPIVTATVETELLRKMVRRGIPFTERQLNKPAALHITQEALTIEMVGPDIGDFSGIVPAQVDGPAMTLRVNATYLLDALGAIQTECTHLYAASPNQAITLQPTDESAKHVIMPLTLEK